MAVNMDGVDEDADRGNPLSLPLQAGEKVRFGEVSYMCAAGGDGCQLMFDANGRASYTGGMVTANSQAYTDRINAEARSASLAEATKLYEGIRMRSTEDNANRRDFMWDEDTKEERREAKIKILFGAGDDGQTTWVIDPDNQTDEELAGWARLQFKPEEPEETEAGEAEEPADEGTYQMRVYGKTGPDEEATSQTAREKLEETFTVTDKGVVGGADLANSQGLIEIPGYTKKDFARAVKVGRELRGTLSKIPGTFVCTVSPGQICLLRAVDVPNTSPDVWIVPAFSPGSLMSTLNANDDSWHFVPDDLDAKILVERQPDNAYPSYGWWLRTNPDGTQTGSVFWDHRATGEGPRPNPRNTKTLKGPVRYEGGVAGLYALKGASGRESESGHFTADVNLTVNFPDASVTGRVSGFKVGEIDEEATEARPSWSVDLMKTPILYTTANPATIMGDGSNTTKWTIDGKAAPASGDWDGQLYHGEETLGADIIPKIAVGQFYTEYTHSDVGTGRMVGAFGADRDH